MSGLAEVCPMSSSCNWPAFMLETLYSDTLSLPCVCICVCARARSLSCLRTEANSQREIGLVLASVESWTSEDTKQNRLNAHQLDPQVANSHTHRTLPRQDGDGRGEDIVRPTDVCCVSGEVPTSQTVAVFPHLLSNLSGGSGSPSLSLPHLSCLPNRGTSTCWRRRPVPGRRN